MSLEADEPLLLMYRTSTCVLVALRAQLSRTDHVAFVSDSLYMYSRLECCI